jgi:hypothetical protein
VFHSTKAALAEISVFCYQIFLYCALIKNLRMAGNTTNKEATQKIPLKKMELEYEVKSSPKVLLWHI